MLPRQHRLTKRKDFEKIWRYGKGFFIKELGFKILNNRSRRTQIATQINAEKETSQELSRFAFIVSTKISKKAVIRNKIKRRLREIIHKKLPEIKPGFDCTIVTRPGIEKLSYQEMKEKMEGILGKLGLINF